MTDEFDYQLSAANFATAAKDYVAVVSSISPLEVLFQGSTQPAINGNNIPLTIGDAVRVTRFANLLVIAGNMSAYPSIAVVSAYAAGTANCTVVAGDDEFDAQTLGAYTPTVGDRVALFWQPNSTGNARCLCTKRGAAVGSPADPPSAPDYMNSVSGPDIPTPPPPPNGPQTALLLAQQIGNYTSNDGKLFTGDQAKYYLYNGMRVSGSYSVDGLWFFGDQVTKVAGATVTKTEIFLHRAVGVGPTTGLDFSIMLHKMKVRPNTLTTYGAAEDETNGKLIVNFANLKPGQSGWFTIPNSPANWGQLIASGTYAGYGMVTYYSTEPYRALLGIDYPNDATKRDPQSGALRLTYKRS